MKRWTRTNAGWYEFTNKNDISGYVYDIGQVSYGRRWFVTMDGEGDWGGFATLKEAKHHISIAYNHEGSGVCIPTPGAAS